MRSPSSNKPHWKPDAFNQGMPEYRNTGPTVSFFEFFPNWLIYFPVALQWLLLSIKYRSLTLPLIANPGITLSGMVGESKTDVLNLVSDQQQQLIAPFITLTRTATQTAQQLSEQALTQLTHAKLSLPVVAKPDLGCRGVGVRLIENQQQLTNYLDAFPKNTRYLLQKKAPYDAEAGIFYIRDPREARGNIFSITFKYQPYVIGDGEKTLRQLILNDERAAKISHLYFNRHLDKLEQVIEKGAFFRLAFTGSHSRGSIFRNGNAYITTALTQAFDKLFDHIDGVFYSRIDVKFSNLDELMLGKNFTVLEINGASSEATHIWDNRTSIAELYRTLFFQYANLFKLGDIQRQAGVSTPSIFALYNAWRAEQKCIAQYPSTD